MVWSGESMTSGSMRRGDKMRELCSRGSQKEKDAMFRIREEGTEVKQRLATPS